MERFRDLLENFAQDARLRGARASEERLSPLTRGFLHRTRNPARYRDLQLIRRAVTWRMPVKDPRGTLGRQ
jgi:hypothetical protein